MPASERIVTIDIIRGYALFGILLVNMEDFSAPANSLATVWPAPYDRAASWFLRFAAEGKFVMIFSFLFGRGFALQLVRVRERGERLTGRFARRLAVLLAIGLLHCVFLWEGDILVRYAIVGAALLPFARRSERTVLRWAIGLFALYVALLVALFALSTGSSSGAQSVSAKEVADFASLSHRSSGAVVRLRWEQIGVPLGRVVTAGPLTLALFLCGLWVGKRGIAQDPAAHRRLLARVAVLCGSVGVIGNLVFAQVGANLKQLPAVWEVVCGALLIVGPPLLGVAYVATLALLLTRAIWQRRLWSLAAVGRMALTIYLLQSLVCTTFFYGYGFGWYNHVGPAAGIGLALLLFAAQVLLSNWWLRHFRFGPMERLWRSLTYLRPQPMRLPPSALPSTDASRERPAEPIDVACALARHISGMHGCG